MRNVLQASGAVSRAADSGDLQQGTIWARGACLLLPGRAGVSGFRGDVKLRTASCDLRQGSQENVEADRCACKLGLPDQPELPVPARAGHASFRRAQGQRGGNALGERCITVFFNPIVGCCAIRSGKPRTDSRNRCGAVLQFLKDRFHFVDWDLAPLFIAAGSRLRKYRLPASCNACRDLVYLGGDGPHLAGMNFAQVNSLVDVSISWIETSRPSLNARYTCSPRFRRS